MLSALRIYETNQLGAVEPNRFVNVSDVGQGSRGRSRHGPGYGQRSSQVMMVCGGKDFDEEEDEYRYVYTVAERRRNKRGFGPHNDPPFYEPFGSREERMQKRKSFGPFCLNCGSSEHTLARDCPEPFLNKSGLIHHTIGQGSVDEVSGRWRRWQQRLRAYIQERSKQN